MVLAEPTICVHCGAKLFQYEPRSFCCGNGEVKVAINPPPNVLQDLCEGRDEDSLNFRRYGRLFNNSFAFSSLGGQIHIETSRHIYVFKLHGQIYHFLTSLIPSNHNPKFLQLYFYDAEHEYEIRAGRFPELRPTVIAKLMAIMHSNPYAQFFQSLRHRRIDADTTICISKNPSLDQRVYNAPVSSEVAGILLDSTTSSEANGLYIVVSGNDNQSHRIMHYYGCYDALQYPLLFPFGEFGWRPGLKRFKRNCNQSNVVQSAPVVFAQTAEELILEEDAAASHSKGKCISYREYYYYLFQIRSDTFLLDTKCILQQFYVDMYVKLENTRLEFFRNNQTTVRADLYQGIIDSAGVGEEAASNIGHTVIWPPSFIGGP